MFSSSQQTETTLTTNSTEQGTPLSKNQRRKLERMQSPNWLGNSHREYESTLYRIANNGRKRYDEGVLARMEIKRAEQMAKKQNVEPNTVAVEIPAQENLGNESFVDYDHDVRLEQHIIIHGDTDTLTKQFGKRQVVVIFIKSGELGPRFREVWELQDSKLPRLLKGSYGNRESVDKLREMGWEWKYLKTHTRLIRHLAGLPPLESNT